MRILVAMSGGVDSSVAAALLHEQGHELIGVTFHLWDAAGEHKVGRCCAPEDRDDARRTCEHLGIAHYVIDERKAFRADVVEPFLDAYLSGDTPSPCVACNQHVKVSRLVELADRFGCQRVATGHYARIVRDEAGEVRLLRGRDHGKDQSYFLYGVSYEVLKRLEFPLGDMHKRDSREHARRLGLPNADKPDSQELCFVPDGDIGGFVEKERGVSARGPIVDEQGEQIGEHQGVYRYTVGQRRGLGLGGGPTRYVLRVLAAQNTVVVGDETALASTSLRSERAAWCRSLGEASFMADVRVRYRHQPAPARVTRHGDGFSVEFASPQRAITRGQAAVVYRGDEVLGGGIIS